MRRGGMYAVGIAGLLVAAGILAWRTWSHTSAATFDPVSAVIGIASMAVGIASFGLAARAQQSADTDTASMAAQLAVAVAQEETEARRQLLGGSNRTINVQFTFKPAPGHEAAGASSKGTLERVVTYYRRLQPQRMVITGSAGSGKTVLAVELILGLLQDRPADAPVPVRMSAASLDTNRPSQSAVEDWMVEHLSRAYKMSDTSARQLVAARMILPVLDGLDEMDADEAPTYTSRAGQAIRACNAYLDGQQKAAVVLTCRISEYQALEQAREWVHDAARIQLLPVGIQAARSFLTARVTDQSRWQPVLDRIKQPGNPPLARAISTPWRLTLTAAVYDQRDEATGNYLRNPADLTDPAMDSEEKIRDHLLSLYILATIATHDSRYPVPYVHRWLRVLASYLNANTANQTGAHRVIAGRPLSGTDLVLHELWPLAGFRLPRIVTVCVAATAILAVISVQFIGYTQLELGLRQIMYFTLQAFFVVGAIVYAGIAWPPPSPLDFRQLTREIKTSLRRHRLPSGFLFRFLYGLIIGPVAALLAGFGLVAGLVAGVAIGLMLGLLLTTDEYSATEPREIIRNEFINLLTVILLMGLLGGFVTELTGGNLGAIVTELTGGRLTGFAAGLVVGLRAGLVTGLVIATVALRYFVFLLCTRRWTVHWLPWRLGKFLHWCYQAGLLRTAGIGYQFRHKEVQDYLAATRPARTWVRNHSHV